MKTFICKIPPNLPLLKGGSYPSLAKRGQGRFSIGYVNLIVSPFITVIVSFAGGKVLIMMKSVGKVFLVTILVLTLGIISGCYRELKKEARQPEKTSQGG